MPVCRKYHADQGVAAARGVLGVRDVQVHDTEAKSVGAMLADGLLGHLELFGNWRGVLVLAQRTAA